MNSFSEGRVILINKPYQWTSFDAVRKIGGLIKKYKADKPIKPKQITDKPPKNLRIGHAGTLDPLATGLLIICTGKFTRQIEDYQSQEKEYTGTICLGATTASYDLENPVDQTFPTAHITEELIRETVKKLTGQFEQTPPIFSAVKVNGKRAYDLARAGKTPEIKAKTITVSEFEISNIQMPTIDFRIVCSKGTYIRSLARDLGLALKSGAHLTALCRTRIGGFKLSEAQEFAQFEKELASAFASKEGEILPDK